MNSKKLMSTPGQLLSSGREKKKKVGKEKRWAVKSPISRDRPSRPARNRYKGGDLEKGSPEKGFPAREMGQEWKNRLKSQNFTRSGPPADSRLVSCFDFPK